MNNIVKQKNKKGFSFLEVIISTFIFSLVIVVAVSAFVGSFSTRKTVRAEQKNLEEARTAMETMAKNIRMSSYLKKTAGTEEIKMFNSSQTACFKYYFLNNKLSVAKYQFAAGWDPATDPQKCSDGTISYDAATDLISILVTGKFDVVQTSAVIGSEAIGKATILINIGTGNELQNIQTTVSFRDYAEVLP